jgi:hypothetical protein
VSALCTGLRTVFSVWLREGGVGGGGGEGGECPEGILG